MSAEYFRGVVVIWADFNSRDKDDRVRLTSLGSMKSLAEAGSAVWLHDWIWLSDGDVRVKACLEKNRRKATVAWNSVESVQGRVDDPDLHDVHPW